MTLHNLLLFVHLLAATAWIGGSILLDILARRTLRMGDREAVLGVARTSDFVSRVILFPGGVITLLAGIGLVLESDAWRFTMGWVIFAIVIVLASAALGMAFYPRQLAALERAASEAGPSDPEIPRRLLRILNVSSIETVALLAVLWAMVFKPGA